MKGFIRINIGNEYPLNVNIMHIIAFAPLQSSPEVTIMDLSTLDKTVTVLETVDQIISKIEQAQL